jgi:hypothetical protein
MAAACVTCLLFPFLCYWFAYFKCELFPLGWLCSMLRAYLTDGQICSRMFWCSIIPSSTKRGSVDGHPSNRLRRHYPSSWGEASRSTTCLVEWNGLGLTWRFWSCNPTCIVVRFVEHNSLYGRKVIGYENIDLVDSTCMMPYMYFW